MLDLDTKPNDDANLWRTLFRLAREDADGPYVSSLAYRCTAAMWPLRGEA